MIPFKGTLLYSNLSLMGECEGEYEWTGKGTDQKMDGIIRIDEPWPACRMWNPFGTFGFTKLIGRGAILEIADVGRTPIRMRCKPEFGELHVRYPILIDFKALAGPVPTRTNADLASCLWTPMYDALLEGGHYEMAMIARSASVSLNGFPAEIRKGRKDG